MELDQAMAAKFPWRRVKTFADVCAMDGAVASRHRHLRRIPVAAADAARTPLPHADVIILRDRLALLGRAYDALPEGGAVIVQDTAGYACQQRMADVGFHASYVECLGDTAMVVGLK